MMIKWSAIVLVVVALCYVLLWWLPGPESPQVGLVLPKDPAIEASANPDNGGRAFKASTPERELMEATARALGGAAPHKIQDIKVRPSNNIPEAIMRAGILSMELLVGCGELNAMNVELGERQQRDLQMALDRYGELRREHARVRVRFSEELRLAVARAKTWRSIEKHPVGMFTAKRIAHFEKRKNVKVRSVIGHASVEEPFDRARYLRNLELEKNGGKPEVVLRITNVVPSDPQKDGNRYIPEITWHDVDSGREYYAQRWELPGSLEADLALCYSLERFSYEILDMFSRLGACDDAAESGMRSRIASIVERINRGVGPMTDRRRR